MIAFLFFILTLVQHSQAEWYSPLSSGSIDGYLTPSEVSDYMSSLDESFSSTALTETFNNNTIYEYSLNAKSKSSPYTLLFTSGHTSTQPLAVTMALYLVGSIASEKSDFNEFLLDFFTISLIPMVNVDAYQNMTDEGKVISYMKNFNSDECGTNPGIDLNRNFKYKFGQGDTNQSDPCSDKYEGSKYFSEKETQAIETVLGNTKISLWLHFDGLGDDLVIPWTFNGTSLNYSSDSLISSYQDLKNLTSIAVGTLSDHQSETYGGSLIDYGASEGILTSQMRLSTKIEDKADIISSCESYMPAISDLLQTLIKPLTLTEEEIVSEFSQIDSNTSSVSINFTFSASNPSNIPLDVLLSMSFNLSGNYSTSLKLTSGRRELTDKSSKSISIPANSQISIFASLELTGEIDNDSFEVETTLVLKGSESVASYSYLSSEVVVSQVSYSSNDAGSVLFYRAWYRSAGHHEGVAIGLVCFFLCVVLALMIVYVLRLYKNVPFDAYEEDEEDEPSSNYIKKEVKTVKSDSFINNVSADKNIEVVYAQNNENNMLRSGKMNLSDKPKMVSIPITGQKFSIDEDNKSPSPVINVPNRPKLNKANDFEYSSNKPFALSDSSSKQFPSPQFPKESEVPIIKNNVPKFVVKDNEREEVKANVDVGEVVLTPSSAYSGLRNEKVDAGVEVGKKDVKVPIGFGVKGPTVMVMKSSSESDDSNDIEILHAPADSNVKLSPPMYPPNYHKPMEKSDDGEFGIVKVAEKDAISGSLKNSKPEIKQNFKIQGPPPIGLQPLPSNSKSSNSSSSSSSSSSS